MKFRAMSGEPAANRPIPPPLKLCQLRVMTLPITRAVPAPLMPMPPASPPEQASVFPQTRLKRIVASEKAASIGGSQECSPVTQFCSIEHRAPVRGDPAVEP